MKKSFLSIVLTLATQAIFAGGGHNVPPPGGGAPPPGLPIDQYLVILFFIGIMLVLYFTRRIKRV